MYCFYNDVCIFFVHVITFWGSKNVSFFCFTIFSGRKKNLVGTLGSLYCNQKIETIYKQSFFMIDILNLNLDEIKYLNE